MRPKLELNWYILFYNSGNLPSCLDHSGQQTRGTSGGEGGGGGHDDSQLLPGEHH